ncbi:phosphate-selective porin OprO and OprP [Catalinimonas alkaloidigena]|uniref:Phosphate-selective porin OprO and OprP n=2 Tax=Catalinimonas alkaloidigena TaxID=1075417 RepID=A0A1G9EKV2_9BACT|nr:phosphate-selective porin OprO and OprP [Catalinimonas alkaloidigena]
MVSDDQTLRFGGRIQTDFHWSTTQGGEWLIRRARMLATGYAFPHFRYMLSARFDRGEAELDQAFVESRHLPYVRVRAGQFKEPFSQSRLLSSLQLDLMERPMVVNALTPTSDIGLMAFGDVLGGSLEYAVGVFNGRPFNQPENNRAKDVVGRLVARPFAHRKAAASHLYVAISGASGLRNDSLDLVSFETHRGTAFYPHASVLQHDGRLTRLGADLEWLWSRYTLRAEWLRGQWSDVRHTQTNGQLEVAGFYITAGLMLTDDEKPRTTLLYPQHEFHPMQGEWGAWEVVLRYEQMTITNPLAERFTARDPYRTSAWTAGLNGYLTEHIKWSLVSQWATWTAQEHSVLTRIQVAF